MNNIFSEYAIFYDLLYQDKDYVGESDYIDRLVKQYIPDQENINILDLACGTGRHAMELANKGYKMTGSDISAEMIEIARERSSEKQISITYYNESFQTADKINKKFDVVLSMFSALNYITTSDDLDLTLKNIRSLLNDKGIFIFDIWNGETVEKSYSPTREKKISNGNLEIIRKSQNLLDKQNQNIDLHFEFTFIENGKILKNFLEIHKLHYHYLSDFNNILVNSGFEILLCCPFLEANKKVESNDWNVTYVLRKT